MPSLGAVALSTAFVLFGGFNVWVMLAKSGTLNQRLWIRVHRATGYAFVAIFLITSYFMLLRLKGLPDEAPPRIQLHMSLAFALGPLLAAKILVARYQKGSRTLLAALGIAIFAASFTLVTLNMASFLLQHASTDKVPGWLSWAVALIAIGACGLLFARMPSTSRPMTAPIAERSPIHRKNLAVLTLSRIQRQTHDAKTLRFIVPPEQRFSVRPGQFLSFEWTIDGKKVFRSYSICSSPTQAGYIEITPKRVANGCVSVFLNERATPGLIVEARGPYGQFYYDELKHKRIVMLAAGSGITPMLAMLRYIDDLCIPVDAALVYCVRTQQDVIFKTELADLQERMPGLRYFQILSQPGPDWAGLKGHLNREILEREIRNPASATFFLCGPPSFMEHAARLLQDLGVARSAILQESFGSTAGATTNVPEVGEPVQAEFARSGKTCPLPSDRTLLEAAEMQGLTIPFGCRQGSCGTCVTRLLSGKVWMEREDGLSEQLRVQGYVLPCVSRALMDVKLDA